MKAAIVKEKGTVPVVGQFESPVAKEGHVIVNVTASSLSRVSKYASMGLHYSSGGDFPIVAGIDGIGTLEDGTRVYFALPESPYGSIAEKTIVNERQFVRLPDGVDDVTAAAIANPAMSSWAALVFRAGFKLGQTVLVNGASGASGSMAVQIARYLGAKKIIATGRNKSKLLEVGADKVITFDMTAENGAKQFEKELLSVCEEGIDSVLDYLWGDSALAIMTALAKADCKRTTRYVSIGTAAGKEEINLDSAILRSSRIEIVGSGGKSVSKVDLMTAVKGVFEIAAAGKLSIHTKEFSIDDIANAWDAPLMPRPVIRV